MIHLPLTPQAASLAAVAQPASGALLPVLLLLAAAVVMFIRNSPRMDAVGLLMMAALPFTGVLTVPETLAGFSDPNVVLIAFLFVLGEGLVRTGIARRIGDWIHSRAAGSETKVLLLLMAAVALLGAVMSSTAIVAIFIPVTLRICRHGGFPAGRLMMPLSFAALISGMLTLIATAPNLVVNAELTRQGLEGFGFFSVTPFGLAVLVLGLVYMTVVRRWLPQREMAGGTGRAMPSFQEWIGKYHLTGRERRVRVLAGSPLAGKSLEELHLRDTGINLLAVERAADRGKTLLRPTRDFVVREGDLLLLDVEGAIPDDAALRADYRIEALPLSSGPAYFNDAAQDLGMAEAVIPADSAWVGQTVRDSRIRADTGLTVIGLRRSGEARDGGFLDEPLRAGDTILVTGFWKDIRRLQDDRQQAVVLELPAESVDVLPAAGKGAAALAILAGVVAAMVTGILPNAQAVLIGCLLMGLFGIIDMKSAYQAVSWKSLVLIVGMLPFSLALQRTGGVDLAADGLFAVIGDAPPRVALAAVFAVTATLGLFISNTATAVLMAPVAIAVAGHLGASPLPFAMTVMLAASAAFMTPVSSPVNTLVVSPGNYRFGDFVKVGVPFTVIVMIVTVVLVPWLLPP